MKRELFVGGVLVVMAGLLLATTLWVKDPGFFEKKGKVPAQARFKDVAGLTKGAEVWIYGTPAGRVEKLTPDLATGVVEVDMKLDYDPDFKEDAVVSIQPRSALGGSIVAIRPGTPGKPKWKGGPFEGSSSPGAFDALEKVANKVTEFVDEMKGPAKDTLENAKKITGDFAARSEQIAMNVDSFAASARKITSDIENGRGSLGKLINDDKLHNDLEAAVASLKKVADDADHGGGTLDKLLHDQEMANDLKTASASLRSITQKIDSGQGSLAKLLNDGRLYDDLAATAGDLKQITADVRAGKGALGKLLNDEAFAKRLDTISDDVAVVTSRLRRGEGTLGKLINDDELYADLRSTLKSLRAGTDDVRENAPILTFAGFLFSGF